MQKSARDIYMEAVAVITGIADCLTEKEYKDLITSNRGAKNYAWRTMRRSATVLVKGHISHPDHATL